MTSGIGPDQLSLNTATLREQWDLAQCIEGCARHGIAPQTEHYPIDKVNDAIQHLLDGKARYRIVLDVA